MLSLIMAILALGQTQPASGSSPPRLQNLSREALISYAHTIWKKLEQGDASLSAAQTRIEMLQADLASKNGQMARLKTELALLQEKLDRLSPEQKRAISLAEKTEKERREHIAALKNSPSVKPEVGMTVDEVKAVFGTVRETGMSTSGATYEWRGPERTIGNTSYWTEYRGVFSGGKLVRYDSSPVHQSNEVWAR